MLAHGLNRPDPPSLLARSPVSARGLPRTLSFARRQAAVLRWRDRRPSVRRTRCRVAAACASAPYCEAGNRVEASVPRRVPSTRSGCVSYPWRFVPRSGCSHWSATTRRASVRIARRKPISGAQRPQPATRHLVRQRVICCAGRQGLRRSRRRGSSRKFDREDAPFARQVACGDGAAQRFGGAGDYG